MNVLELQNLTKRFGKITALENVSLNIEAGKITGLLGPNGSGKTTMIKVANGLLSPTEGECRIMGLKPGKQTKALVAYLPDRVSLPDWMTVDQLTGYFADFYKDFDRAKALSLVGDLGVNRSQGLKQMSKGTKEKVQLVMVMSRQASLYLLDEPLSGVDPATRDYILNTIIRNYNPEAAVIISTHLISDVEKILDDVVFIKNGAIVLHETVDEIREQQGMSVDEYFREVFRI